MLILDHPSLALGLLLVPHLAGVEGRSQLTSIIVTVEGVEDGTPQAARALDTMAAPPAASPAPARSSSSGPTTVNVNINAPGATKEAVDAMSDESFLQKLRKALLDELATAGVVPA